MACLALFDLDDTLIDREAAFGSWARSFAARYELGDGGLDWLLEHDFARSGLNREQFFAAVAERYQVDAEAEQLVTDFLVELPTHLPPVGEETFAALRRLREAGWKVAVITNGSPHQLGKLQASGLLPLLDTWCISEEVGVPKPNRAIFELAAERCGATLSGGWIVGDAPEADMAGGRRVGLRTAWIHRGRYWPLCDFVPDATVATPAEAVDGILPQPAAR
jgi:FMN phosphatase YigB (HAD superfamily)